MFESRLPSIHLLAAIVVTFAWGLGAPKQCSAQFVGLGAAGAYGLFEETGNLALGGSARRGSASRASYRFPQTSHRSTTARPTTEKSRVFSAPRPHAKVTTMAAKKNRGKP